MIAHRTVRIAALLAVALVATQMLPAGAAPASKPAPKKLTVAVFTAVAQTDQTSKATLAAVAAAAAEGVPKERFEEVALLEAKSAYDARSAAKKSGAQVLFVIGVGKPQRITHKHNFKFRMGRRDRQISVDDSRQTLRTTVTVEMSISGGSGWYPVQKLTLTSAEAPPGEETTLQADDKDIREAWTTGARHTTRVAVERVVNQYFLRDATLRATEANPVKNTGGDDKTPGGPVVQIELTNRSHARIQDATISVEVFDEALKIWRLPNAPAWRPRMPGRGPGRPRGGGGGKSVKIGEWKIPAIVDPGEKAVSYEMTITDEILLALKSGKARAVLHATPRVTTLRPPRYPHALKPEPKVDR